MAGRIRIKVCCISSAREAELAISYGVDAVGLVGEMPSGPGVIHDDVVREIAAVVPPTVETFLLTSRTSGADIADHIEYCGTTTVRSCSTSNPTSTRRSCNVCLTRDEYR